MKRKVLVIIILVFCIGSACWINRIQVFKLYANLYPEEQNVRIVNWGMGKYYYIDLGVTPNGYEVFEEYMGSQGWKHLKDEQMGAIYTYEKDGTKKHMVNSSSNGYFLMFEKDG